MSIPVDLEEPAATMKDYPTAFLITVNEDLRVHAVQVHPKLTDGAVRIAEPGRRTSANLAVRPDVTVLFPPYEPGGYTLLVDGRPLRRRRSGGGRDHPDGGRAAPSRHPADPGPRGPRRLRERLRTPGPPPRLIPCPALS